MIVILIVKNWYFFVYGSGGEKIFVFSVICVSFNLIIPDNNYLKRLKSFSCTYDVKSGSWLIRDYAKWNSQTDNEKSRKKSPSNYLRRGNLSLWWDHKTTSSKKRNRETCKRLKSVEKSSLRVWSLGGVRGNLRRRKPGIINCWESFSSCSAFWLRIAGLRF